MKLQPTGEPGTLCHITEKHYIFLRKVHVEGQGRKFKVDVLGAHLNNYGTVRFFDTFFAANRFALQHLKEALKAEAEGPGIPGTRLTMSKLNGIQADNFVLDEYNNLPVEVSPRTAMTGRLS